MLARVVKTGSAPSVDEAAEHLASTPPAPLLVPLDVSRGKLAAELAQWEANKDVYRRRGWLLLSHSDLTVEVAFVASVAVGNLQLPAITASIRLTYENYDLWPPSLTFIDPRTGELAPPVVQAPDTVGSEVRNVLLGHPNGRPFLCIPGVREYHNHPQHSGDDWLLHRSSGAGRLAIICDIVWRRMVRNVLGLTVNLQSLPRLGTQLNVGIAQGDIDLLESSTVRT